MIEIRLLKGKLAIINLRQGDIASLIKDKGSVHKWKLKTQDQDPLV